LYGISLTCYTEGSRLTLHEYICGCFKIQDDYLYFPFPELPRSRFNQTESENILNFALTSIIMNVTQCENRKYLFTSKSYFSILQLDSSTLSITSIDLDTVRKIAMEYNLNPSEYDEVQLQEGLNDLKAFLQSDEMKETMKNIGMMTKLIDENTSTEDRCKKIGGWTGASIVSSLTGTVVGGGVVLAFAPVSVPAICATAFVTCAISSWMGHLGFAGGQEGGSVIARLRWIPD
jgi:hypothetical protein